jgi:hypothetical protein
LITNDFHALAFIIQLIAPAVLVIASLDLIVINIFLLGKRGFFTLKKLAIIAPVLVIMIIAGISYGKLQNRRINESLTKYPDIEFTNVYYLKTTYHKNIYGYWDSETNSYTQVDGSDCTSVMTEEKFEGIDYLDVESKEVVTPFCIAYNRDNTVVYYSYKNFIFRYNTKNGKYDLVSQIWTKHEDSWDIRKIVVSDDESMLYVITQDSKEPLESDYMYKVDTSDGSFKRIISNDGYIEDMELTPDGSSIIYYAGNMIRKYDIASRASSIIFDDTLPKDSKVSYKGIIRVSGDGRFIMYCIGSEYRLLGDLQYVYVYDTVEHTTEKVINTTMCEIKDVDWVR